MPIMSESNIGLYIDWTQIKFEIENARSFFHSFHCHLFQSCFVGKLWLFLVLSLLCHNLDSRNSVFDSSYKTSTVISHRLIFIQFSLFCKTPILDGQAYRIRIGSNRMNRCVVFKSDGIYVREHKCFCLTSKRTVIEYFPKNKNMK